MRNAGKLGHAQGLPVLRDYLQESKEQADTGEAKSLSVRAMEARDQVGEPHPIRSRHWGL